jgi:hypothetical protein
MAKGTGTVRQAYAKQKRKGLQLLLAMRKSRYVT